MQFCTRRRAVISILDSFATTVISTGVSIATFATCRLASRLF